MIKAIALFLVVALSGCSTLGAVFSPYRSVPGWSVRYTGELPRGDTPETLSALLGLVAASYDGERVRERLDGVRIWFRSTDMVHNKVPDTYHAGLYYEPSTVEVAVGGRSRLGDTALVYELFRVLHRGDHVSSLHGAEHQARYGAQIKKINDAARSKP